MKDNYSIKDTPTQQELRCMKERLTRCLQLLKINHDNQISTTAFKLIEKAVHEQIPKKPYFGQWIIALNAIAGSCVLNQRVFSQSEIYDFLTVAVTTSIEGRTKVIDEIIFRIYRDIMTNYESSDNKLKIAYPKIIVDVVAILAKGVNANGKRIPIHNVESYYQMRKSDVGTSSYAADAASIKGVVPITTTTPAAVSTSATASSIKSIQRIGKREEKEPGAKHMAKSEPVSSDYKEQQQLYKEDEEEDELIESLNKITDRNKKDIQAAIAKLQRIDILRISDLCKNYNKLQKYSNLITDAKNQQKFKTALENDIGRKLSDYQLQHAVNSIRKAKLYIEKVLDGKFIPHGSYGINHTKHNLEYGYLIVGLMQPSRKRITTKGNP
jgi:hypothetical protein